MWMTISSPQTLCAALSLKYPVHCHQHSDAMTDGEDRLSLLVEVPDVDFVLFAELPVQPIHAARQS